MLPKTVRLEDTFIDLAFEMGPVQGMTPDDIKKYIRYIADWRLRPARPASRSTASTSTRCPGWRRC